MHRTSTQGGTHAASPACARQRPLSVASIAMPPPPPLPRAWIRLCASALHFLLEKHQQPAVSASLAGPGSSMLALTTGRPPLGADGIAAAPVADALRCAASTPAASAAPAPAAPAPAVPAGGAYAACIHIPRPPHTPKKKRRHHGHDDGRRRGHPRAQGLYAPCRRAASNRTLGR
jgi:hypothetical protein